MQDQIDDVPNMDICQFVCDKLHEELALGKFSAACLLHLQLLYVDSLEVSGLNIDLPDGRFVVNIWSKKDIDLALEAVLKRDGSGYGNLEASFLINLMCLFLPNRLYLNYQCS